MESPFDSQYDQIRERIIHYADMYGIDRSVAIWQIWQENRFRSSGCSGAGACGIAQFMPATAERFGVDRSDIESSLNGWGRYMRWLLDRSYIAGDIRLALGGYNAGEGRIQQYGGLPPFSETQNYVRDIMANAAISPVGIGSGSMSEPGAIATGFLPTSGPSTQTMMLYGLGFLLVFLLIDD